jgi:PilZ domain
VYPNNSAAQRREQRWKRVLPLRVSIQDGAARSTQLAYTLDISNHGARLGAIRGNIPIGAKVVLQYGQRRIPSRVIWVKQQEGTDEQQIGVELLVAEGSDAWGIDINPATMSNEPEPEVVCV